MVSSLFALAGQQPLRVSVNTMGPFAHATLEAMEIDVERVRAASYPYRGHRNSDTGVTAGLLVVLLKGRPEGYDASVSGLAANGSERHQQ